MSPPGYIGVASMRVFARPSALLGGSHTTNPHSLRAAHLIISRRPHLTPGTRRNITIAAAVETTITTTQHLFTELHHVTGTPWFVTIPLIALSVNLIARLPLTIYTRKVAQRRAELTPIIRAWSTRHVKDISKEARLVPGQAPNEEVGKRLLKTSRRLFEGFGVQRWKDYSSFGVFPVWIISIESLRRLCGGPRGLIGTLVFGSKSAEEGGSSATSSSDAADVVSTEAVPATQDVMSAVGSGADPSLATGGCLWFPDLMAADPSHILPFALSAILVANILPRTQYGLRAFFGMEQPEGKPTTIAQTPLGVRFHRALMIVALFVGPATMDLPAALHLYWISSATLTMLSTELVHKFMPLPKSDIKPCAGVDSVLMRPTR
ncbi:hypothetical protein QBC46DRAFT_369792 [Diplogelasinospora grovesii]|uniref:Uncharacterized protein n=1 Tax=Diplogelasinospora grovesii TaxID=303347 RepID=A0AAN6SAF7_9PEZI|nr:hypothetical protein QBC46DRAFT_369792 [Diplogelasinospora grovesii]